MIRISLTYVIFLYLFAFLAVVSTLWVVYEMRRKRREQRALRYRLKCATCGLDYEDRTNEILPRCPRCGSLNERAHPGFL